MLILMTLPLVSLAQVKFAIVCNQSTYQLEVIVEGRQSAQQQVLRGDFPNQAAAESYMNSNASSLNCRDPKAGPPPRPSTSGPPPRASSSSSSSSSATSTRTSRSSSEIYPRKFMLIGTFTSALNLNDYYDASGAQNGGLNLGIRMLLGEKTKWGIGVQYASLFGTFEPVNLDVTFGDEGSTNAIRTELLALYPQNIGDNTWLTFSIGAAYYLNYQTDLDLDNDEFDPQPTSSFWGGAFDIGVDIKGFNIGLGIEFTSDILEFQSSGLRMLRVYSGIAF